jgi:hypothetical protein
MNLRLHSFIKITPDLSHLSFNGCTQTKLSVYFRCYMSNCHAIRAMTHAYSVILEKPRNRAEKYRNGYPRRRRRLRSQNPTPYPLLRPLAPPVFSRPLPTDAATRAPPPMLHAVRRGHRAAAGGDPVEQGVVQLGAAHRDGRHRRRTAAAAQRLRSRKGAPRRLEVGDQDHMVFLI